MPDNTMPALQAFHVEVSFFSGGDYFASEIYSIEAVNWYGAEQAGLEMSTVSAYDNPRVPDLRREVIARLLS